MSCAQVETPHFTLVLDTIPPRVSVAARGIVEPPDVFSAILTTSEPYARLEAAYTDALGDVRTYGVGRTSPTTATLRMPTVGLAPGGGMLTLVVSDDVGNTATVDWPLVIDAPRGYDVDIEMLPAYEVEMSTGTAYQVDLDYGHAMDVQVTPDHPYEVDVDLGGPYDVAVEAESA